MTAFVPNDGQRAGRTPTGASRLSRDPHGSCWESDWPASTRRRPLPKALSGRSSKEGRTSQISPGPDSADPAELVVVALEPKEDNDPSSRSLDVRGPASIYHDVAVDENSAVRLGNDERAWYDPLAEFLSSPGLSTQQRLIK